MKKPVLVIVNGLPASGKTTLAKRLGADVALPVFSRDGIFEALHDAFQGYDKDTPPATGLSSFKLLYALAGAVLAAEQSAIVEGFFGRPDLRSTEFLELQSRYSFEPFQIVCRTEGNVLLERFLARTGTSGRHSGHQDLEWLEQNRERLLQGQLTPLTLDGPVVEVNTTTPNSFDYKALVEQIRALLNQKL